MQQNVILPLHKPISGCDHLSLGNAEKWFSIYEKIDEKIVTLGDSYNGE